MQIGCTCANVGSVYMLGETIPVNCAIVFVLAMLEVCKEQAFENCVALKNACLRSCVAK